MMLQRDLCFDFGARHRAEAVGNHFDATHCCCGAEKKQGFVAAKTGGRPPALAPMEKPQTGAKPLVEYFLRFRQEKVALAQAATVKLFGEALEHHADVLARSRSVEFLMEAFDASHDNRRLDPGALEDQVLASIIAARMDRSAPRRTLSLARMAVFISSLICCSSDMAPPMEHGLT